MCQVAFEIPNEVLYDTHMQTRDAIAFARKWAALGYYVNNNVSIGYCAEIADMTEEEFMLFLGQNQIDVFHFEDDEELLRDVANA
ncbi:MAG: UPF0175 family protein [Clostridia bacterium]|nr:UPF0175 family protein [Clostridia bacterium]